LGFSRREFARPAAGFEVNMGILLAIWKVVKGIFWFCYDNWKVVLPVIIVILAIGFGLKHCNRPAKLDEKQIIAAQQAIETHDREAMVEILAKSDTAERQIDANVKAAEKATENAKKNYTGLSNDDLAAELNKRAQQ
jgi:hypothetical protein